MTFILLFIYLTLFNCDDHKLLHDKIVLSATEKTVLVSKKNISYEDLNGAWAYHSRKLKHPDNSEAYKTTIEIYYDDEGYRTLYTPTHHWVIEDSTIYVIDYPCTLVDSLKLRIFNDTVFVIDGLKVKHYIPTISKNELSLISCALDGSCSKEIFRRDSLDASKILFLKENRVNSECLYGRWYIPQGEINGWSDDWFIEYPWQLPVEFNITKDNLNEYWDGKYFYIKVDGKKRSFNIKALSNTSIYDKKSMSISFIDSTFSNEGLWLLEVK